MDDGEIRLDPPDVQGFEQDPKPRREQVKDAVDAALKYPFADQDIAHKVAAAIREKNDVVIAYLSSMR